MTKMPPNATKELLSKAELSVWLDDYDDIFSDFDSRALAERSLSDDFLVEMRKMVREKPEGDIELKLLIPTDKRRKEVEALVIKNLHAHFKHAANSIKNEITKTRRQSIALTLLGFLLMVTTAYIVSLANNSFFMKALQIVLEPSGWFMVWTGLDNIFYNRRRRKPNLVFFLKMEHADIQFLPY
jgi:hypothetical protein